MTSKDEKSRPSLPCILAGFLVVVILSLLGGWVCGILPNSRHAREGTTEHLIDQLSQATKAYELDMNAYPPGDGNGSNQLALVLGQRGPKNYAYYEFIKGMRDKQGNILSPIGPIHYRCPGIHNSKSFDLWAVNFDGTPSGINNWEDFDATHP